MKDGRIEFTDESLKGVYDCFVNEKSHFASTK